MPQSIWDANINLVWRKVWKRWKKYKDGEGKFPPSLIAKVTEMINGYVLKKTFEKKKGTYFLSYFELACQILTCFSPFFIKSIVTEFQLLVMTTHISSACKSKPFYTNWCILYKIWRKNIPHSTIVLPRQ